MRKYDFAYLGRLARLMNQPWQARPFPGRIPVRMYVKVTFFDQAHRDGLIRFVYNGRWSYSVIRRAERFLRRSTLPIGSWWVVSLIEYVQNGVLYWGNLAEGAMSPNWPQFFMNYMYDIVLPGTRIMRRELTPLSVISLFNHRVLVADRLRPAFKEPKLFYKFCEQNYGMVLRRMYAR